MEDQVKQSQDFNSRDGCSTLSSFNLPTQLSYVTYIM